MNLYRSERAAADWPAPAPGRARLGLVSCLVLLCVGVLGSTVVAGQPAQPEAPAPSRSSIAGTVSAANGYRISHVLVRIPPDLETLTDAEGRFSFDFVLSSEHRDSGSLELIAAYSGFEPVRRSIPIDNLPASVELVMIPAVIQEYVTVEAPPPTDEDLQPRLELDFLDIVATAGSNADPLFTVQTLPGVVKMDEGSGLFVRGGDSSEVAVYLDRALLDHPYRHETPTGGFFGTVDAFELSGFSLSAGGFPARYGNALSAVLQLEGRDRPAQNSLQLGIGLAALSLSYQRPVGEHHGLRFAINRRDASALVELNHTDLEFREPPAGSDLGLRWNFSSGRSHALRLRLLSQESRIDSELEEGAFVGFVDSDEQHRAAMLGWEYALHRGEVTMSYSRSRRENEIGIGVLDLDLRDDVARARFDLTRDVGALTLRGGAVYESVRYRSLGILPRIATDFGGAEGFRLWSIRTPQSRRGGYLEVEQVFGLWALNVGARADRHSLPARSSLDPRVSVSLRPARDHLFRSAWGIYSQSPEIETLTRALSFADLELSRAEHRVVGYELRHNGQPVHLRVELYDKVYRDLPLEGEGGSLTSDGFGSARGLDVFLALNPGKGWDGWISYSFLEAERLYTPWQQYGRFDPPEHAFLPDFAVPHTLQLVLHQRLPWDIQGSVAARLATGRPFTPVVGAALVEGSYRPVYGDINSERVADYRRLDLSASRPFAAGAAVALVYLGINDVLDRRNVQRFVYSEDFALRRPARTAFGRTLYFGVSFQR